MIQLRDYQTNLLQRITQAWHDGAQNVCAVMPCGAGKTVTFSTIIKQERGVCFAIAHRQELISQMSLSLARMGVKHSIVAPETLVKHIIKMQIDVFGQHYYDPKSTCIATGVLTFLNRADRLPVDRTSLWVVDECHHLIRNTVWGKAVAKFPNTCRGLGVTATPGRADGQGLGRHADGVFDVMVEGPSMRGLIQRGYLTDYRVFGPYSDIDLSKVTVSAKTGDYSKPKLTAAIRNSRIVGDVIKSYLDISPGRLGVVFVPDVRTGEDTATAFSAAGVPAQCVHAKTPDFKRQQATSALARGDIKILTNVDVFGEGFDLPAIEVVSMARPTQSLNLYIQQFGRGLRTMEGKDRAIIIDHVKNVEFHGLPDRHRVWSLDRREGKGKKAPSTPVRTCQNCLAVYESYVKTCPYCGYEHKPHSVSNIEVVEGVITELSPDILAKMRGEIARIDGPPPALLWAPVAAQKGAAARHRERQKAQAVLREAIAVWAGYQTAAGQTDDVIMRRFYRTFGVDVLTAQTLSRRESEELTSKLKEAIK
jgi:superfamily II DNA or RNA helicase